MAHSSELFHGSHDSAMFAEETPGIEVPVDRTDDNVATSLGATARTLSDIEREWGPARRRPDAPKHETPIPEDLSWSA